MNPLLVDSLTGIGPHLLSFILSVLLLGISIAVFMQMTPYKEIALIKEGNCAAAIALSGCVLGFAIPLARAVAQSANFIDLLIWSAVALLAQIGVYGFFRFTFKDMVSDVQNNKPACAIFLAAANIAIGLLNSAGMSL